MFNTILSIYFPGQWRSGGSDGAVEPKPEAGGYT